MSKITKLVDEIEETLVPPILTPVVKPPLREKNPLGGRPRMDESCRLAKQLEVGKEYYLENSSQILLKNIVGELPCRCTERCEFIEACSLMERDRPYTMPDGQHPDPNIGNRCPIEYELLMVAFYGYCTELGIDPNHPTEIQTAAKLASLQVYQRRLDIHFNLQGLVVENCVGVSKQGEPVYKNEKHPLWDARKDLERREEAILKQFYATREQIEKRKQEQERGKLMSAAEWLSELKVVEGN